MTVSDQIIQVLNVLCAKFGVVIDWTSANVIPYLETLCGKLVTYEIWTSVAWMAFSVIGVVLAVIYINWFRNHYDVSECDIPEFLMLLGVVAILIVSVVGIITQVFDIVKCVTFPEMYVFEYIQNLINSGS